MPFEKGNKLQGSRKGVPNKTTQEIREAFQLLIENNQDKMQLWLTETAMEEPARALEIILKMSEYIVPKLSNLVWRWCWWFKNFYWLFVANTQKT